MSVPADGHRTLGFKLTAGSGVLLALAALSGASSLAIVETLDSKLHAAVSVTAKKIELIGEIKTAKGASAPADQLTTAQDFQRKAQFYLDFVEAENSSGFHAPGEALRILGESINFARKGQLTLRPAKQP